MLKTVNMVYASQLVNDCHVEMDAKIRNSICETCNAFRCSEPGNAEPFDDCTELGSSVPWA